MIYFDNAATTKPSKTAILKAQKFNEEFFYNPSALYGGGIENSKEITLAKETLKRYIGGDNFDVIFTSCGTESDNLSIFGCVKRGVFVTSKGEHSAVYKSFLELKNKGQSVEFIDLNPDGTVNTEKLFEYVKNNKVDFVSIVHVNNETGGINDINYIAKTIKSINNKIIFHSDGVQAFGKIKYLLSKDIDLYSVSAHKINGLKGTGALFYNKKLNLSPIIIGGGQEKGLRSGTENIFGIKVMEYALEEKFSVLDKTIDNVKKIKEYIKKNLDKSLITVISGENSSPYILTISAENLRGEVIMHILDKRGIIVGNGSACSSKNRYSRVIESCGYNSGTLDGVIRLSFSIDNSIEEAKEFVNVINEEVKKLKEMID